MAHFYGTLQGARGEASRLGHKSTGLVTYAAGWGGAVRVQMTYNEDTGEDTARVTLEPWQGSGGASRLLYDGPVNAAARTTSRK